MIDTLKRLLGLEQKRPVSVEERLSSKPMEQWTEDERAFMRLRERNKTDSGPGAEEEQAERVENSILDIPPENWTDSEEALVQKRAQKRAENDPMRKAVVEGREAERKAQPHIQDAPFSPGRLAEDFEGMLVDDLRSRDIPLQRHAPELQQLPGEKSTPSAATSTPSPARRTSAGRAAPRADVQPLDSSLAVKAGQALLSRLKSPGNGSALPDSVRQWARKGQPAQSEDASGSGGGEGGNGTSRMDWARLIDSGAATVAGVKPNSEFYDAVERRGERKDNLKAEKEKSAQAESLRRAQMAQSERQHIATLEQREAEAKQREEDRTATREDRALARKEAALYRSTLLEIRRGQVKDSKEAREERTAGKDKAFQFDDLEAGEGGFFGDATEARKVRSAQAGTNILLDQAQELESLYSEAGSGRVLPGETQGRLSELYQALQSQKRLNEGMGAPQGYELELLEKRLADPTSLMELTKSSAGMQQFLGQLRQAVRGNQRLIASRAQAYNLKPRKGGKYDTESAPAQPPPQAQAQGQGQGQGGTVTLVRLSDGKKRPVSRTHAEAFMRDNPGKYRVE